MIHHGAANLGRLVRIFTTMATSAERWIPTKTSAWASPPSGNTK